MRLNVDWIELQGFRSFIEPTVLDFADLGPGLHFVRGDNQQEPKLGSNGAGKSSLWSALCWCLYGKTITGLRRNDVAPWIGDIKPHVRVAVNRDGTQYIVARNDNALTIDGKTVGQEQVDELVGLPIEIFSHTILLGQGQPLFFDLSPKKKLDLFSSVLNLDRWDLRVKVADARVQELQFWLNKNEGLLLGWEHECDQLESMISALKEQLAEWERQRVARLESADADLDELRKRQESVQKQYDIATLNHDGAGTELKALRPQIDKLETELNVVRRNFSDFKLDEKLREKEINDLSVQLESMQKGKCPTCGQPFKSPEHVKQRKLLQTKLERLKEHKGIPKITVQRIQEFEDQLAILKKSQYRFQHILDACQDKLNLYGPMLAEIETKIRITVMAQSEKREEANPYRAQLQDSRHALGKLKKEMQEAREMSALYQRRLSRAQFWVKGFKELKLYQIEEVLQELEIVTNSMLQEVGLDGWSIKYAVERETASGNVQRILNVGVLSTRNSDSVKWEVWSGGEGQRLRLIGSLALSEVLLNHVGIRPGIEILDEPTQHLSPEGVQLLCEFLADRARRTGRQIIYCDQHSVESTRFQSTITVVKTSAGSSISCA